MFDAYSDEAAASGNEHLSQVLRQEIGDPEIRKSEIKKSEIRNQRL